MIVVTATHYITAPTTAPKAAGPPRPGRGRWLPVAAVGATLTAVLVGFTQATPVALITAAAAAVLILAWLCWSWPAAGWAWVSTALSATLLTVITVYITPPWLPGGFDWLLLWSYWSLAILITIGALTVPARRGHRVLTATWFHVSLLALPIFAPLIPGPSMAAALLAMTMWLAWRSGAGRLPRVVLAVNQARKLKAAGHPTISDVRLPHPGAEPEPWVTTPKAWTVLHDRATGWGRFATRVPHLLIGEAFGAAVIIDTGPTRVGAAARQAVRVADTVAWALKLPPGMVHAVVLTAGPGTATPAWVRTPRAARRERTRVTITDPLRLVATVRSFNLPHADEAVANPLVRAKARRFNRQAKNIQRTLPEVADLLLPLASTRNTEPPFTVPARKSEGATA